MGTMAGASVLSGLLGIVTSVALTSRLGLGTLTDAYFMAFSVLLLFNKLARQGTFRKIYISVFSPLVKKGAQTDLKKTVTNFHSLTIVFFGPSAIILIVLAPWIVPLMAPGFDAFATQHTVTMVRFLFLTIVYTALTSILIALYQSYQKFTFPAMTQVIPSILSAIAALFILEIAGVYSLIWAFLIGACIHLVLLYMRLPLKGLKFSWKPNVKSPDVKNLGKLLFPFYFSEISMQGFLWVQNILASLLSPGTVSVLVLARKIRRCFAEYILRPLSTIVYPSLVKSVEDKSRLKTLVLKTLTMSNFVILPAVIWFVSLNYQLVRLIFQHGAFSPAAINNLAGFLTIFGLTLVTESTTSILTKILFARQKTVWINIIRFVRKTFDIILSLLFFKYFGFLGLAWAVVVGTLANFIMTCFFTNKIIKLKTIFINRSFLKIVLNVMVLFFVSLFLNGFFSFYFKQISLWQQALQAVLVISIGSFIYILLAHLLKIEELRIIASLIKLQLKKMVKTPLSVT